MHEVSLRDLHHRLRSLRSVEAYPSAVETTILLVLIRPGFWNKRQSSEIRSCSEHFYVTSMNQPITDAVSAFGMHTELSSPRRSVQEGEVRTPNQGSIHC